MKAFFDYFIEDIMPRFFFLVFLTFVFLSQQVGLALADDLTANIRAHYKNMTSFTAEFNQTLTHRESGAIEKRSGKISFRKPLKLRWQTQKPREELLLITDAAIWNYIPDENVAYKYNPNLVKGASSIIQVITGQADLMSDFDVKRVGLENDLQRLKLYPKNPTTQLVEADIWVDSTTGVIRKSNSIDFYGNSNEITFKSYEENLSLRDALFSFTPPKGVEVEDRRDQEKDLLR